MVPSDEQVSVMQSIKTSELSCAFASQRSKLPVHPGFSLRVPAVGVGGGAGFFGLPAVGPGAPATGTGADVAGDQFDLAGNWSTGSAPGSEDIARFAVNQAYDVNWGPTTGDVVVEGLLVQIGSVGFVASGGIGSLTTNTATIGNQSDLRLDGVDLAINGNAQIQGDVTVTGGAIFAIADTAATLGNDVSLTLTDGTATFAGFVNVGNNGPGALVLDTGSITTGISSPNEMEWGSNAAGNAQVDFVNGSTAVLGANTLQLSEFGGTTTVNVSGGSVMRANDILVASAVNAGQAQVTVSGADSVIMQSPEAVLAIGKTAASVIASPRGIDPLPMAQVHVIDQAIWDAGSGGVTVNATGQLTINSGGQFKADAISVVPGSGGVVLGDGGALHAATFTGALTSNGGIIEPWSGNTSGDSIGPLTLVGDATLVDTTVRFELRSDTAFDQVVGDNLITMTGTTQIELPLRDGFRPTPFMAYEVFRADTEISFETLIGPAADQWGVEWGLIHPDLDVLAVVPVVVYTQGDFNLDGRVDLVDLDILGTNWELSDTIWGEGDASGDRITDLIDLDLLGLNWGVGVSEDLPAFDTALAGSGIAVPEPASLAWLTFTGAAIAFRRRRSAEGS